MEINIAKGRRLSVSEVETREWVLVSSGLPEFVGLISHVSEALCA